MTRDTASSSHDPGSAFITRLLFLLTLACILVGSQPGFSATPVRIATAGEGTLYNIFGTELAAYLNSVLDNRYSVEVLETAGSQDNIERLLLDPGTMLALSQEDVAHFYYKGVGNDFFFISRQNDFRITSLGRPFSEVFYCVTLADTPGLSDMGKVHVGLPKSGSYVTYTSYRMDQKPTWEEVQLGDNYELLQAGEIDGFFEVEANPNPSLTAIEGYRDLFKLLPIRRTDLTLGLDIYQPAALPDLADTNGGTVESIAIPTILLCSRDIPLEISEAVIRVFFDEQVLDQFFPLSNSYLRESSIIDRGALGSLVDDHRFFDLPLPPHPVVVRQSIGNFPYVDFILPLLGLMVIWVLWGTIRRWSPTFKQRFEARSSTRSNYRDGHFVLVMSAFFLLTIFGIKYFEIQELISGRAVSGSGFISMGFTEVVNWLFIFLVSGYSGNLYPVSPAAGFLPIGFKILGGFFFTYVGIRVLTYIVSKILERRGTMLFKDLEGHIVICNWNEQVFRLVELLKGPDVPPDKAGRRIVIVTRSEVPEGERENLDCLMVGVDAWEKTGLVRARAEFADSIIIVPPCGESTPHDADGIVLRTVLAVNNHLDLMSSQMGKKTPPSIVAELNLQDNRSYLEDLGIDEVVISRDIGMRMLAQAVICPGASFFFNEILDAAPESNEVYATRLPSNLEGEDADFRLVLNHFAPTSSGKEPVLPIAIRVNRPENADPREWGNRSNIVLVNPLLGDFERLGIAKFRLGDEILVLADNPVD